MLYKNIKIGDRIEISMAKNPNPYVFISQVEEILGNGELLIHMPISYGSWIKLPLREQYDLVFINERGKIIFSAEVTGYRSEKTQNYLIVKINGDGQRIQMRAFYRYMCLLPLKFAIIKHGAADEEEILPKVYTEADIASATQNETFYDGIIKDIGGGGIRFVSNLDIEEGSIIKCGISLNEEKLIIAGKIIIRQYFPKSNYKYQYRVQFTEISQSEQEKIIQYIFVAQRAEMLRMQRDIR